MKDQHVELHQLTAALAVAETGSFRRAASKLGIGQSSVSRRIQKLEDRLGVSLFERQTNGARLTPAGICFSERVRYIVNDLNVAVESAQHEGTAGAGRLSVGVIASLSRGPIRNVFHSFFEAHPEVVVCIKESDRGGLLTDLSHRKIDAMIAVGEPETESGDSFVLARERIFLAVPSSDALATVDQLSVHDLHHATLLLSDRDPGPEVSDYILRCMVDIWRNSQVQRHKLGREGLMALVGLGLGVCLVTDHWRGVTYPNVRFVPIGNEEERVPFSLTWRPETDNPALRRFISLGRIEAKRNGVLS
ncbi:LysR family transcriptional regulator [Roseobacter weihaiensis]|uniref:LysR family transcriptional regulator n=1 Tax=Roseobacter weihaiensis TaxID=2763262 RepID=UPI001D0B34F7